MFSERMHLADASMSAAGLGSCLSLSGVRGAGIIAEHGNTSNWTDGDLRVDLQVVHDAASRQNVTSD